MARGPAPRPRRWARWLAPLAAAASVVLIVVAVSAVHLFAGPGRRDQVIGPPRYYAGRYLILAWAQHGWIDHGRLRLLPPQGGAAFADAW